MQIGRGRQSHFLQTIKAVRYQSSGLIEKANNDPQEKQLCATNMLNTYRVIICMLHDTPVSYSNFFSSSQSWKKDSFLLTWIQGWVGLVVSWVDSPGGTCSSGELWCGRRACMKAEPGRSFDQNDYPILEPITIDARNTHINMGKF